MSHEKNLVDYSHENEFSDALIAQGFGNEFLALFRLEQPFVRFDGKRAQYELKHRWLSQECKSESDQSWACVMGAECTYWQRQEIVVLIRRLADNKQVNIFDHFCLF